MAQDDHALVVGISAYPDLGDLKGPENDAIAFHKWLVGAGGVPRANATLLLSSTLQPPPPFQSAAVAQPTRDRIYAFLDALDEMAAKNEEKNLGRRVGRRLYLFFAGHGFGFDLDEAVILMANATRKKTGHHVPGKLNANRFLREGLFDEVVLLMDCCRTHQTRSVLSLPPDIDRYLPDVTNTKRFYAFSAMAGKLSLERQIDGETHGVFTATLMKGLEGAAAEASGSITASSLGSFLRDNMKTLLTAAELADSDIAREPDLNYHPVIGANFVLATAKPPKFTVTVTPSQAVQGGIIRLLGPPGITLIDQTVAGAAPWNLQLHRGMYALVADNVGLKNFEVTGAGAVDVGI